MSLDKAPYGPCSHPKIPVAFESRTDARNAASILATSKQQIFTYLKQKLFRHKIRNFIKQIMKNFIVSHLYNVALD